MKQYTIVAAAGTMMFICGCQSPQPTAAEQEILSQLKEINASLKEIAKNTPSTSRVPSPDSNFVPVKANSDKLSKVKPLPDNPTDADIRSYIEAIQVASIGQNNFAPNDPQVELYRKIGTGHFKVWLPYLGINNNNFHLYQASASLLDDQDKAEAIKQLSSYPNLADAVIKKGWAPDAKEAVFAIAAGTNNPYVLMPALKTYTQTPEDRQKLTDLYLQRPEFYDLYKLVSSFDGANPGKLAQKAWENQRFNSNSWNKVLIATRAASAGNLEALGEAVNYYASQPNAYIDQDTAMLLTQTTGQILNKEALRKWYQANQDKLVFNAEKRRFEVK